VDASGQRDERVSHPGSRRRRVFRAASNMYSYDRQCDVFHTPRYIALFLRSHHPSGYRRQRHGHLRHFVQTEDAHCHQPAAAESGSC
jgi:hypothetical protein